MNSVYDNRHGKAWATFNLSEKSRKDDADDDCDMQKVSLLCRER